MNKLFFIFSFFLVLLVSCNKDIGKNPAPMEYYIDIDGKTGSKLSITYSQAILHTGVDGEQEDNMLKTEEVVLPFTKAVTFWREDKKISYPSVSLSNTTNDNITVLLSHESGSDVILKLDDNRELFISSLIKKQRLQMPEDYYKEFKAVTIDSLHYLLKKENYKWIKVLRPQEGCKLELPNNWVD